MNALVLSNTLPPLLESDLVPVQCGFTNALSNRRWSWPTFSGLDARRWALCIRPSNPHSWTYSRRILARLHCQQPLQPYVQWSEDKIKADPFFGSKLFTSTFTFTARGCLLINWPCTCARRGSKHKPGTISGTERTSLEPAPQLPHGAGYWLRYLMRACRAICACSSRHPYAPVAGTAPAMPASVRDVAAAEGRLH